MFNSPGGDVNVAILEQMQPKMDWNGPGYKWNCVLCNTRGTSWLSKPDAVKAGEQHVKLKHPNGVPNWLN